MDEELENIRLQKLNQIARNLNNPIPHGVITIGSIEKFNEIVNRYLHQLIIVEFFAQWCGPCKSFKPIYESLQPLYEQKGVVFLRIDSEAFPEICTQFNVMGVPAFLFIKEKKGIHRVSGAMLKNQFQNLVDSLLGKFFSES